MMSKAACDPKNASVVAALDASATFPVVIALKAPAAELHSKFIAVVYSGESIQSADALQCAMVDLDQRWGAIGPRLITTKFYEAGLSEFASAMADFYPISPAHFWKLILPEGRESVESAVRASKLLHLWHKKFELAGYNKDIAPPRESYLPTSRAF
ncbi:hypothetical protein [Rhizobium sp. 007]|uniref:hypothetical protein n=1 Tax=Rhizobium sp. 007 TaxID=2785056 RepID=UPI001FF00368|nr:hypothetical protein [Rhizobium sp. 007]